MQGNIKTADLHRMAYNALLYSPKGSYFKGSTLWTRGGSNLWVTAYDDYMGLIDYVDYMEHEPSNYFLVEFQALKELEKMLREWPDEEFDLAGLPGVSVESHDLQEVDRLIWSDSEHEFISNDGFAVAPDRLRKLSLIKPGSYPIDARFYRSESHTEPVLAFRCGPTVRGAFMSLDRTVLKDLYANSEVIWND